MARGLIGTINDEIASGGTITGDLTVEGDLTISGSSTSSNYDEVIDGHVQVTSTNKLKFGGSTSTDSDSYILESSADVLDVYVGAVKLLSMTEAGGGASDKVSIPALTPLYLDGGGNSYIAETAGDTVKIVTGGSNSLTVTAATTTVLGDLVISGDDLSMATNTSGAALIADGTNFNPVVISGDIAIATNGVATIQANSVALTTDTTGNYVATITGGNSITSTAGTTGEGTTHSLSVDDVFVRNDGDDTTTGVITIDKTSSATNSATDVIILKSQSSGTPAAGIGTGIQFGIETAASNVETAARIVALTTDVSSTNEDIDLVFYTMLSGDAATEALRVHDDGNLTVAGDLTVSGGDITLGTSLILSGGNTTSLNLIDAIDATTESTIEAAIDTLANLTSVQGNTLTLGGNFVTQNNNVTINASGAARTLTLTESLTIGDGNDGTITFSGASKTLTVEDTTVVNQDLSSDASPTFAGVTTTNVRVGVTGAQEIDTSSGNLTIDSAGGTVAIDDIVTVAGTLTVGTSGSGQNVTFYSGNSSSVGMVWDEDGGTGSANGYLALGANDHGVDFKVFGDTASKYMSWDSSADTLEVAGTIQTADLVLNNDRGHYLIVEEEDYLSIKNEKTGKLYKFVLEEIDGS